MLVYKLLSSMFSLGKPLHKQPKSYAPCEEASRTDTKHQDPNHKLLICCNFECSAIWEATDLNTASDN